jgi:hypothetical protein
MVLMVVILFKIPFIVQGEKDEETNQRVNYTALIPLLITELQKIKKEIKEIKEIK